MLIYARDHATAVLRNLQREAGRAAGVQNQVAASAALVGRSSAYMGAVTAVAMVKSANAAGRFEASLNILQASSKANNRQMAAMQRLAIDLGNDLRLPGVTAQDAADTMLNMSRAGLSVRDVMSGVKGVLQLATAGEIEFAEASKITSGMLNSFHLAGSKAVAIADMLAAASNKSSAELHDVAIAAQQGSAAFAANRQPVDALVTSIAMLANAGIRGSDAGTSLRVMIQRLTAPTAKAKDAMKALGVETFDQAGRVRPLRDIILDYSRATAHMTDAQKAAAFQTIFGTDAMRAANIVLAGGVEKYDKMHKAVMEHGAAQALAAARMKGWQGTVEALMNALQTLGIELGLQLIPQLTVYVQWITKAVQAYSRMSEGNKELAATVLRLVTLFALGVAVFSRFIIIAIRVAQGVGGIVTAVKWLVPLLQFAGFALRYYVVISAMAIGKIALVARAFMILRTALTFGGAIAGGWVAIIIAGIVLLALVVYKYRKQIWDFLVGIWQKAFPPLKAAWAAITGFLVGVWQTIYTAATTTWNRVTAVIVNSVNSTKSTVTSTWNGIWAFIQGVMNSIWQFVQKIWHSQILQIIRNVVMIIATIVGTYFNVAFQIVRYVVTGIATLVGIYLMIVLKFWKTVFGGIIDITSAASRLLSTIIKYIATFIWMTIQIYFKLVWIFWKAIWRNIVSVFTSAWQGIWSLVRLVIANISLIIRTNLTAIRSIWNSTWTGARNIAKGTWDAIWFIIGPTMKRIGDWISSKIALIRAIWRVTWDFIKNFVTTTWSSMLASVTTRTGQIRDRVDSIMRRIKEIVSGAIGSVKKVFGDAWAWVVARTRDFSTNIGSAFNGIKNALRGPLNWVINNIINNFSKAFNAIASAVGVKTKLPIFNPVKLQRGGQVPGQGIGDKVPALLEPREIVIPTMKTARRRLAKSSVFLSTVEEMLGGDLSSPGAAFYAQKFAAGGIVPANVVKAQRFARSQAGKPYRWGGAGPGGYDCSGFMSAIRNVLAGDRNPYRHTFATGSFARGRGIAGMVPGFGLFTIGVMQGNPGHMAGTLGGLNVESRGGRGVIVGTGARGAKDPLFRQHFFFKPLGGSFITGDASMIDFIGMITRAFSGFGGLINKIAGGGILAPIMRAGSRILVNGGRRFLTDKAKAAISAIFGSGISGGAVGSSILGIGSALSRGLSAAEAWIIQRESGGQTTAQNPRSTAFGLGQLLLSNRTRIGRILGFSPSTTNYDQQLAMFRYYYRERYGTAERAKAFWMAHHYYGNGGVVNEPTLMLGLRTGRRGVMGESGPEAIVPLGQSTGGDLIVNFYGPVYGSKEGIRQLADDILQALLNKQGRWGGIKLGLT